MPGAGSSTRNGGGVRSQLGTATNVQLSVLSEPYWTEFEQRFGVDPWLRRIGYLFLAGDGAQLHVLRGQVELQHQFGVASELLAAKDLSRPLADPRRLRLRRRQLLRDRRIREPAPSGARAREGGRSRRCHDRMRRRGDRIRTRSRRDRGGADNQGDIPPRYRRQLRRGMGAACRRASSVSSADPKPPGAASARIRASPLPPDLPWLIGPLGQVHVRRTTPGRVQVGGFLGVDETVDPLAVRPGCRPRVDHGRPRADTRGVRYRDRTIIGRQELGRHLSEHTRPAPDHRPHRRGHGRRRRLRRPRTHARSRRGAASRGTDT